jgi:hypothetical protein
VKIITSREIILQIRAKQFWLTLPLLFLLCQQVISGDNKERNKNMVSSMFWTWQDTVFENQSLLVTQLKELKSAGFKAVYAMPRATRYQIFDKEMIAAVKTASDACKKEGVQFMWGPDPRFGAHYITQKTGYGAELLMVNTKFNLNYNVDGLYPERLLLNECKITDGRYSLRYEYPMRRDVHMLTEVGLWLNPISVEKVYAYQRKDGKVITSSIRDITPSHHFFINRSFYYVEVFGKPNLPEGEWYVVAFPRFMTNMYAFDAPQHEKMMTGLLEEYKKQNIHFDGFWWDEPGYYFQFGHYAISERIYKDFLNKYGYDLKEKLYALLLPMDDNSQLKVRYDYFELLMDYVFGGQKRFWQAGEKLFGPLRMGIHHTWHTLPDNMYAGCADYWRGLEALDGGYTDDGAFEQYFKADLAGKYEQASFMVLASSLAKFSRNGVAYYNRWGTNYTSEVPIYWNDVMSLFSNVWIQHCYGSTAIIGASRNFGPGFPDHELWKILPDLIRKVDKVINITKYKLPVADVAVVFPIPSFLTAHEPTTDQMMEKVNRLVGIMPALGIQADAISDWLFAEGKLKNNVLHVRNQKYKAVLIPSAKVVTKECLAVIIILQKEKFPIYFADELPQFTLDGKQVTLDAIVSFNIGSNMNVLASNIEKLNLPSPVTKLKDAYVTVIPGDINDLFVMIMPIVPGTTISGQITCMGKSVNVEATNTLSIYHVDSNGSSKVK